jgi:hypothetical protein
VTTITNSLIVQNSAPIGSAIKAKTLDINNSTISRNNGVNAIDPCFATLTNVTITNNNGGAGVVGPTGNCGFGGGATYIRNSLIAGHNTADVDGPIISQGNNLVQNRGTSTGYIASDLPNGTNPMLAPLANNGGLSATHALLTGSPAINAGNNTFASGTTITASPTPTMPIEALTKLLALHP